jgi:hypothetical protein
MASDPHLRQVNTRLRSPAASAESGSLRPALAVARPVLLGSQKVIHVPIGVTHAHPDALSLASVDAGERVFSRFAGAVRRMPIGPWATFTASALDSNVSVA